MLERSTQRLMLLIIAVVFAFLYLPISVLFALSFNEGGLPTAWTGFSVKWYGELLGNNDILQAALNTLIVAVASTIVATLLGTLLAIGVEIRRRNGRFLETIIFAPMIIPDIVLAIALLSFFSMLDVRMGLHTIIVSHVVFNLAFVCSVVRARLKTFDWSIVEASADLGATTITTLRRIVIPVLIPAVVAGALLALAPLATANAFEPGNTECIAPANAGGGWDFTCRQVAKTLQDLKLVPGTMQVTNLAGGGGGVAYAEVINKRNDDNNLIVAASSATSTRLAQGA